MTAIVEVSAPSTRAALPARRCATLLRAGRWASSAGSCCWPRSWSAIFAPVLAPYDPYAPTHVTIEDIYQPPSAAHPLGTDDGGKDVLSQLIYGVARLADGRLHGRGHRHRHRRR